MKESEKVAEPDSIRLGLSVPLFTAAIIAIAAGTLVGMIGIWGAAAWGKPVPEWQKIGHAHSSWWGVLLIIASMLMPYANLKPTLKRLITIIAFIAPVLWISMLASYYETGKKILAFGVVSAILEILLFASLLLVALSALVRIPFFYHKSEPSRFDIVSDVYVQKGIFLIPTLIIFVGVLVGFALAWTFKITLSPIKPAALVQLHDHVILISASAMIILLAMSVFKVSNGVFKLAYNLMRIALPLTLIGLILFNVFAVHSLVWVIPAGIYFILLLLSIPAIYLSKGSGSASERGSSQPAQLPLVFPIKLSTTISLSVLAILISTGAYIALAYDTSPYITVTYKQPAGSPYPGPYPSEYIGTAPAKDTPRGLENAHLSPGSWFHVAIAWLIVLALFGDKLFGKRVGLLNLLIATIPMAPLFNTLGRYLAWLGIPNGIGALWFAGHPLKGFNIVVLFIVGVVAIYTMKKAVKSKEIR
ncbi:MAG: hypothetical protein NZ895_05585 [Archaeoglobaceae archaeon]|nr:hypothetical protein [Archaeoglobaceae archaeon]MCX8151779.1 hypothetical protein [Archaeoglobaceae archaeon]MDW8013196.1 hypothetical protein [Archaeoglobaceae archaeon]